jgi:hypothetical protein
MMNGRKWAREHLFKKPPDGSGEAGFGLHDWLARLRLAPIQQIDGLEITPLILDGAGGAPFVLGPEAIDRGLLEIVEQGSGSVPTVEATHKGEDEVLILEGDTLIGCKQNRIVAHSVIIAPGSTINVSVGCMESGRWAHRSPSFSSGKLRADPWLRKKRKLEVMAAMRAGQRARIDQAMLWNDVEEQLACHSVGSSTRDYHRLFEERGDDAIDEAKRFTPVTGQVGVIALWRGHLLGLEIVGHPDCWSHLARRTLPAYLMVARNADQGLLRDDAGEIRAAEGWLEALNRAPLRTKRATGAGLDFDFETTSVYGSGLWHAGRPAHLAMFSK